MSDLHLSRVTLGEGGVEPPFLSAPALCCFRYYVDNKPSFMVEVAAL